MRRLEEEFIVGEALRVAPARQGQPAANFWKFWTSGSEIYALSRASRGFNKVSVHQSGQIHIRLEGKDLQPLAPPLLLGNGNWLHALELRFLLNPDAFRPWQEKLKGKRAFLIDVPPDTVLFLNLLVGQVGLSAASPLPHELLPAAKPVWRATLSDQRPVVLTCRVMNMDVQNIDYLKHTRDLGPKANFSGTPKDLYMELMHYFWSPEGGNVIIVMPMGKESFRVHDSASTQPLAASESRVIAISSPNASTPIAAPNGAIVGTLSIVGTITEATLARNSEVRSLLGTVTLSINPPNLIFGESFKTPTYYFACGPTVGGGQPKNWGYPVRFAFDGATLKAEIRKMSAALRNADPGPIQGLGTNEEIVVRVPFDGLVLKTTVSTPQSSATLEGGFLLRDI
jgi:hypothetical protein